MKFSYVVFGHCFGLADSEDPGHFMFNRGPDAFLESLKDIPPEVKNFLSMLSSDSPIPYDTLQCEPVCGEDEYVDFATASCKSCGEGEVVINNKCEACPEGFVAINGICQVKPVCSPNQVYNPDSNLCDSVLLLECLPTAVVDPLTGLCTQNTGPSCQGFTGSGIFGYGTYRTCINSLGFSETCYWEGGSARPRCYTTFVDEPQRW